MDDDGIPLRDPLPFALLLVVEQRLLLSQLAKCLCLEATRSERAPWVSPEERAAQEAARLAEEAEAEQRKGRMAGKRLPKNRQMTLSKRSKMSRLLGG